MITLGLLSLLAVGSTPRAHAASAVAAPPSIRAWGAGLTAPSYSAIDLEVVPHPDDEGALWADGLNEHSQSFPVMVVLTNGENAGACADGSNSAILPAPAGHLGAQDRPPFNTAGDIPGAVSGSLGPGLPPEALGAQGDDPPFFPRDPALNPSVGWDPLERSGSVDLQTAAGPLSEGFSGSCRAARLASLTVMLSSMNQAIGGLSAVSDRSFYPSVAAGQPPDGQVCFNSPQQELYSSRAGAYSTPDSSGVARVAPTTPGLLSPKDPCAYYWLTGTGDLFVFNLGDMSEGYRAPCASSLNGSLRLGPPWPAGTAGYDSIGDFPEGSAPGQASSCPAALPAGQEAYGLSPSDTIWAIQAVASSVLLPPGLPIASLEGAAFVNGFTPGASPTDPVGGLDVAANRTSAPCRYLTGKGSTCDSPVPPAPPCSAYVHAGHLAVGLALYRNSPLPGLQGATAVCSGDPLAKSTFGTLSATDGSRFWTQVYDYDGGSGWEAAPEAYAWISGPGAFDPYGPVTDTCPGSSVVQFLGQTQWSCQESLASNSSGGATYPGDAVIGMSNSLQSRDGVGMTPGL